MSIANKADQIQDNNFISEYAKLPEVKLLFFFYYFYETCYVKQNSFEALLKDLLLVKQYRVEVWKRNKNNEWVLSNHMVHQVILLNLKT